jgi:hypothetical protein
MEVSQGEHIKVYNCFRGIYVFATASTDSYIHDDKLNIRILFSSGNCSSAVYDYERHEWLLQNCAIEENYKSNIMRKKLVCESLEEVLNEGKKKKVNKWIQGAEKDIEKRGTEGVCSNGKLGGPTCKPGSKRYVLAKTFKKIAKKKKK